MSAVPADPADQRSAPPDTAAIPQPSMPIRIVLAIGLCLYVNLAASRVAFTLYALELDAKPFEVGAILAVYYVFPLLLSWPAGRLSDRFGARTPLLLASLCGAFAMAVPFVIHHLWALFAASAISGLSMAFYNVIIQSLVGQLSTPEDRTRNFSNITLVGSASNFVGPLITGYAIEYAGPAAACGLLTLPCLLAVALLVLFGGMLPPGRGKAAEKTRLRDALRDPDLWRMLTISAMVQLGMDLFQFTIPLYGHSIGLSGSAIGWVLSGFSAASFGVRMALPKLLARASELRLLGWSFYLGAAGFLLIPLSGNAFALGAVSFLFGLSIGCSAPLTMMLMFSRSVEGRSGETMGLRLTMNNTVRVVGPTLFGSIGSAFGLVTVFVLCTVVMTAGGLLSRDRPRKKA
jgi:MFS family permease